VPANRHDLRNKASDPQRRDRTLLVVFVSNPLLSRQKKLDAPDSIVLLYVAKKPTGNGENVTEKSHAKRYSIIPYGSTIKALNGTPLLSISLLYGRFWEEPLS
jgi:hypothetical protein